jgi:hypothetical protein
VAAHWEEIPDGIVGGEKPLGVTEKVSAHVNIRSVPAAISYSLPSGNRYSITGILIHSPGTADTSTEASRNSFFRRALAAAASVDRFGMGLLRLGLVVVLIWIGGLKFASYEADGIVPLVSNSPLMSFFYHHPAAEYSRYMNREGELIPAHRKWQESNGTYRFSYELGIVIVSIGLLIALVPNIPTRFLRW